MREQKFTDRVDLVRIDNCYHRFHLLCVFRDWFMKRHAEWDEFGGVVEYKVAENKRCPICRRQVEQEEIDYIRQLYFKHPSVRNMEYS